MTKQPKKVAQSAIVRWGAALVFGLGALVATWFFLANLQPIGSAFYLLALVTLVGVIFVVKVFFPAVFLALCQKLNRLWGRRQFRVILVALVVIVALLVRLWFFFHYQYAPRGDPVFFYTEANNIATGVGIADKAHVSAYPYLAPYSFLLGVVAKLISNVWLAAIILNFLLDFLSALCIFSIVRRLLAKTARASTVPTKAPFLAFTLWLLSPLNILFSLLSMPVIAVNFFIAVFLLLVVVFRQKLLAQPKWPLVIIWSILLGLVVGLGNSFRPVLAIGLIALAIWLVFSLPEVQRVGRFVAQAAAGLIIIAVMMLGVQELITNSLEKRTGYAVASGGGGWSVFVGANRQSGGQWNAEDWEYMLAEMRAVMATESDSFAAMLGRLQDEGIERYKSYGLLGSASLMVQKLHTFASGQTTVPNVNASLKDFPGSTAANLLSVYNTLFLLSLFGLVGWYLYQQTRQALTTKTSPITGAFFITLLLLGFFFSHSLVEVMSRYALIIYPLLTVLAGLAINSWEKPATRRRAT